MSLLRSNDSIISIFNYTGHLAYIWSYRYYMVESLQITTSPDTSICMSRGNKTYSVNFLSQTVALIVISSFWEDIFINPIVHSHKTKLFLLDAIHLNELYPANIYYKNEWTRS